MVRVRYDHGREDRTNVIEAILAEGKSDEDLILSIEAALSKQEFVLVTRVGDRTSLIAEKFDVAISKSETMVLGSFNFESGADPEVGIIAAGTSDTAVMDEVEVTLMVHGIASYRLQDVGVANLRRTTRAIEEISRVPSLKVLVLIAGQEGALFSVIPGLTKLPCIAVPSPVGYGLGGKGQSALYSALQSCSPGLVTVNIGNGFGAAAFCVKLISKLT